MNISLLIRLVSGQARLLDRPHPGHRPRRIRSPRHLHAHHHLPRRRLHHLRRLRPRRQHRPPLPRRRRLAPGRTENVRDARPRLGQFVARIHRAGHVSDPGHFLQVR